VDSINLGQRHYGGSYYFGRSCQRYRVLEQWKRVIAELKAGSEEAYSWLIDEFQSADYGLIYRIVNDPSDARRYYARGVF